MANVVSTVEHNTASRVQTPGPGQLFSVTAMSSLRRQFGGVKEKEEEKLPFCWLAPLRLARREQKCFKSFKIQRANLGGGGSSQFGQKPTF